ncbi:Alpha/Beta hydrolase protein [Mariannaea sp. PMI_226]|nr:Alpha/Beta hydrolase protein [Mariannaea sp. PMI_226]
MALSSQTVIIDEKSHPQESETDLAKDAVLFARQAEKLSYKSSADNDPQLAVKAQFVTPQDCVIITSDGQRLPGVPLQEAHHLNNIREAVQGDAALAQNNSGTQAQHNPPGEVFQLPNSHTPTPVQVSPHKNGTPPRSSTAETLQKTTPPSHTNPLFPPLPLYGPPSLLRKIQCLVFRVSAFFLSLAFLGVIVLGALFTSIPLVWKKLFYRLTFRDIDKSRPFFEEEKARAEAREEKAKAWERMKSLVPPTLEREESRDEFPPTEGGHDPIVCDVGYYARRVGLDVEAFEVQTEDGFLIDLWHVYDPKEYTKLDESARSQKGPNIPPSSTKKLKNPDANRKFPVLLMHGLLQSSGAFCCNDDESLAFWLCKSGYDVWLGNNRCGFKPKHVLLDYEDPRMWCWNIRQMGVFDLPALSSRVIIETGFKKIGLVCHSQGTTQAFVALAKEQRPELGEMLTVFCALAPAAYAGPLIGKMYFKFMRIISPGMFRLMFGIHAFIPFMMQMHQLLPPRMYGWLGYKVFSFLFDWTDERWDRGLRDRMFQFAPVYVSAESMRWWLGRECFAKHKCILATRDDTKAEEYIDGAGHKDRPVTPRTKQAIDVHKHARGATAWYNTQAPPFAMWVAGTDNLVDGEKLLRRFAKGREPYVNVVHSKVIPEYEHLDVIWAMDAVEQVFKEVREVLWKTCDARDLCRIPEGCEHIEAWTPPRAGSTEVNEDVQSSSSGSENETRKG